MEEIHYPGLHFPLSRFLSQSGIKPLPRADEYKYAPWAYWIGAAPTGLTTWLFRCHIFLVEQVVKEDWLRHPAMYFPTSDETMIDFYYFVSFGHQAPFPHIIPEWRVVLILNLAKLCFASVGVSRLLYCLGPTIESESSKAWCRSTWDTLIDLFWIPPELPFRSVLFRHHLGGNAALQVVRRSLG